MNSTPNPDRNPTPRHVLPASGNTPQAVHSSELFNGGKCVCIEHQGEIYRLQTTKLGKLILTK